MSRLRISWLLLVVGCASGAEDVGGSVGSLTGLPGQTNASSSNGNEETGSAGTTGELDDDDTGGDDPSTSGSPSTTNGTNNDPSNDDNGETTDGDPDDVNVQNHTGVCGGVVWCSEEGSGQGVGPHAFAECFDNVGLAPPFDVVEVRYAIGQKQVDPTDFKLEVRNWSNNAPGNVIGSQNLTAADISVGVHGVVLQSPIRVNASSFCIALEANEAFAVRRDETNPEPGRAFIQADDCNIIDYVSLEVLSGGDFASNFCMSAKIRPPE